MSKISFMIDDHKLQLTADMFGRESVIYDGETLSKKFVLLLKSEHGFEVSENGNTARYKVFFEDVFPFCSKQYSVLKNEVLIRRGRFVMLPPELIKALFLMIGIGLLQHIFLVFLPAYEQLMIAEKLLPSSFGLKPFDQIIGAIFGVFLIVLVILPKELLVNRIHVLSVIFWAYIGLTITALGSLVIRYMREGILLDYGGVVVFRVIFIWLLFYILEAYVGLAREGRSRE